MHTTIRLRPMQQADLQPCVDLCMQAYSNHFFQLLEARFGRLGDRPWAAIERQGIRDTFAQHLPRMFVATGADRVVGYILYQTRHALDGQVGLGYLSNNAVDPRFQGQGIGRRLGQMVQDTFVALGLHYARTTTSSQACQAPARQVYQRLGYRICRHSVDWILDLRRHVPRVAQPCEMPPVSVRQATPADLERLLTLARQYFDGVSLYALWAHHGLDAELDWRTLQTELVGEALRHRLDQILVSEVDGEVVGFLAYDADPELGVGTTNVIRGQGEDMALNNAVDPRFRGQGLEAYQLAVVCDRFRQKGLRLAITRGLAPDVRVRLGCTIDYEAWGFEPLRGYVDLFMKLPRVPHLQQEERIDAPYAAHA